MNREAHAPFSGSLRVQFPGQVLAGSGQRAAGSGLILGSVEWVARGLAVVDAQE